MLMTSMPPWVIHACVFHLRYSMLDDLVMISFILFCSVVQSSPYDTIHELLNLLCYSNWAKLVLAYILFLSGKTNCWTEEASGLVRAHQSLDGGLEVLCKIESL
jgi:hypothetical protein